MLRIQYQCLQHYSNTSDWEWIRIRHCLLNYLKDFNARVSVFLKKGLQSDNSYFKIDLLAPLSESIQVPEMAAKDGKPTYNRQLTPKDQYTEIGSNLYTEVVKQKKIFYPLLDQLIICGDEATRDGDNSSTNSGDPTPQLQTHHVTLQSSVVARDARSPTEQKTAHQETLLDLLDQITPE